MELTNQEIEDERRRGRIAGIAALGGVVIFIISMATLATDFNAADLPMMMRIQDLPARYRRHFLGA